MSITKLENSESKNFKDTKSWVKAVCARTGADILKITDESSIGLGEINFRFCLTKSDSAIKIAAQQMKLFYDTFLFNPNPPNLYKLMENFIRENPDEKEELDVLLKNT
ncbi:MAG: hypothetical protein RsTaC01_0780 [Candidatus Paraimprobicoccus trichonymphae]|uniref:Uncharacterized protein n=1 Tax=Candidatus Paraimprobicoccus trichonymphae TaxID=3033793 RepID=A0AA48L1J4_9FIRM|nr:MAG: hypothetical protein RsTaC01_0780 [Candidatus Paraimprobicoccus trichonymphae]